MDAEPSPAREPAFTRKPESELRHWSTYDTVGEWFADHHGYVPIQMAAGIDQLMRRTGCTFVEAYGRLVTAGKIIHVREVPAAAPDANLEPANQQTGKLAR